MDKRVIFACAGSGKTTYIVDKLSDSKRTLIITYTDRNKKNLFEKITKRFNGEWPKNVELMSYFSFLYGFCYKPFLSDRVKAKGIVYESNPNNRISQSRPEYYMSTTKYLYSNRLALLLEKMGVIADVRSRIIKYFDEVVIDEIQDIAGRDFDFLCSLMQMDLDMLFVGDFYQHTFDTSRDGSVNKNLFEDKDKYQSHFERYGVCCDNDSLKNSWRCNAEICNFIREKLEIPIFSNVENNDGQINYISDKNVIAQIANDSTIVKLHYNGSSKYGDGHLNWGETKGEDKYEDVCVLLNKTTFKKMMEGKLYELPSSTKNKLYVAISRAHRNVYLVNESDYPPLPCKDRAYGTFTRVWGGMIPNKLP